MNRLNIVNLLIRKRNNIDSIVPAMPDKRRMESIEDFNPPESHKDGRETKGIQG